VIHKQGRGQLWRSLLERASQGLLVVAVAALSTCAVVLADARLFQWQEALAFDRGLRHAAEPVPHDASFNARRGFSRGVIGRLQIPRLGVSVMVLDSTDARSLRRGVGHIEWTALPGQPGTVGLAGHRDTFFRALAGIARGDQILLETRAGIFRYVVDSTETVKPDNVDALETGDRFGLALVTCYPFHFVGAAPLRFIVHAAHVPSGRESSTIK
jgi:sortase A